jgi:hypothetical protein
MIRRFQDVWIARCEATAWIREGRVVRSVTRILAAGGAGGGRTVTTADPWGNLIELSRA